VSEPSPEQGPPLEPDDLRRLEEMVRDAGNMPDMTGSAIEAIAGIHARWYFSWQAAGVPEARAAEWTEVMLAGQFRS
jgi:hypothetical protein